MKQFSIILSLVVFISLAEIYSKFEMESLFDTPNDHCGNSTETKIQISAIDSGEHSHANIHFFYANHGTDATASTADEETDDALETAAIERTRRPLAQQNECGNEDRVCVIEEIELNIDSNDMNEDISTDARFNGNISMEKSSKKLQAKQQKLHKCQQCCYSTSYKHHLRRHIQTHSGQKPFTCETCAKSFTDRSVLNRHRKIHQFNCSKCGCKFILRIDQIIHEEDCFKLA